MFVSLPTGRGNSLCYCLLPRAFDFLRQRTALRESSDCSLSADVPNAGPGSGDDRAQRQCRYTGGADNIPPAFKGGKTN